MRGLLVILTLLSFVSAADAADVFERHRSEALRKVVETAPELDSLSLEQAIMLKSLSPTITSPCVVVRTNDGNLAKAQLAWGFRKGPGGEAIPVLLIERYVTYRSDREDVAAAAGQDIMLFAGFALNLDIGQIVPEGQGGDITLTPKSILKPLDSARLYGLDGSQLAEEVDDPAGDPRDHEGVLPRDFAGKWTVSVDGRWRGEWDLKVVDRGRIQGKYVSEDSRSSYDLTGRIAALPHNLKLDLHLDNATQSFDAFLWTKDKSTMAGTTILSGRKFGFHAVRQTAEEGATGAVSGPDTPSPASN